MKRHITLHNVQRRYEEIFAMHFIPQQTHSTQRRVTLVDRGLYEYGYFNICFLNNMMSLIVHTLSQGYVPHIALADRQPGWSNWDTFFLQPFGTTADQVRHRCADRLGLLAPSFMLPYSKHELKLWCKVYNSCVHFNSTTAAYLDNEYHSIIEPAGRVLGVICRGTDYVKLKPQGHPAQPDVDDVIKRANAIMKQFDYPHIYLATEERSIVELFEKSFPNRILVNKRQYYDTLFYTNNCKYIYEVQFERDNDIYLKGLEYLSSINLLSKCNALLGGNCGGALAALYMNNMHYEYSEIFNLGLYK